MGESAAITGLGCVSGLAWDLGELERRVFAGDVAIRPFAVFPHEKHRTHLASEAPPALRPLLSPWSSRVDGFAVHAARAAVEDSGISTFHEPRRVGVFFGTSTAGMLETERLYGRLLAHEPRLRLRPVGSQQSNAPGDTVARTFGVRGPVISVSTACVSGAQALMLALDSIRSGEVDLAIAGGADGLCQLTYSGFNALRAVDSGPCVPYRAHRQGLSLGEGAGVLLLEAAEHAQRRGARVHGWLAGAGSTCDAHHMAAPEPSGEGATRAIIAALEDAGVTPDAVDFVNVHGTGTPLNDAAEAKALHTVFGPRAARIPLTSTKSLVGHLLGAAGAFEAVVTVLCLARKRLHPTAGPGPVDSSLDVDLVLERPRELRGARVALSTNLAFGGANTALILSAGAS